MRQDRLAIIIGCALLATGFVSLQAAEQEPVTLGLQAIRGDTRIPFPLQRTEVRVEISAFVARTVVEQTFVNPFDEPIEAVYTFPLGDEAAVDDFELRSGDRVIRGEILRRETARQTYETARAEGYQAALLEQERPNLFVQTLSNLMPGNEIRIRLQTVEVVPYKAGVYEYLFPMVAIHRYLGDVKPPRLAPDRRSGDDIRIHVELQAGVPIGMIESPNQTIYISRGDSTRAMVDLSEASSIPNQDFILRWDVSAATPSVGWLTHRSELDGFVTLLLQPKGWIDNEEAAPKETVIVIDTSGSMNGEPIRLAKEFVRKALLRLRPQDRFNLIRFANKADRFSRSSVDADPDRIDAALTWMQAVDSGGGTEMLRGLRKAVSVEEDPGRARQMIFLTDGGIGFEDRVIQAVEALPDDVKVFTVGIGTEVNHYLLRRMAEVGGGEYTSIATESDRRKALDRFMQWVTLPYLTDLEVDWGGLPIADLLPERPSDLFAGQTLALTGRTLGGGGGTVRVHGYLGGRYWEQTVDVELPEWAPENRGLASIWARRKIKQLLMTHESGAGVEPEVREEATGLALKYRLMSPFTSFVAVDDFERANPTGEARTVAQPLPVGGALTESVRVTSEGSVVVLESTATATRFSDAFIQDLPVPARLYQNVFTLTTGASDGSGNPNANGSRDRDFKAMVEGISNVDPPVGALMSRVSPNSIEELEIITAGAGVEFGGALGGFASIVQKAGSNGFGAELDLGLNSHALDGSERDETDHTGYHLGGVASGALVRDRLWYRVAYEGIDEERPVDRIDSTVVRSFRSSSHADRLTWQVSPRNKLSFDFNRLSVSSRNDDAGRWLDPDAGRRVRQSHSGRTLRWTVPYSPRVLFETRLAHQRVDSRLGANEPGATNDCLPGTATNGRCTDLVAKHILGPSHREIDDEHNRTTFSTKSTLFAGHFLGTSHTLKLGAEVEKDRYARSLTRNPNLVRGIDSADGAEVLFERFAPDPARDAATRRTSATVYVEDELKPRNNVALILGLRWDRQRLRSEGIELAGSDLSPSLSVAWDPASNGKTKLFLSGRRYYDTVHPALALIELEPITVDRSIDPITGTTLDGLPNIQSVSRSLVAPHKDEWTTGVEREIFAETSLRMSYVSQKFENQIGHVDLNRDPDSLEDPRFGEILLIANLHSGTYRAYVVELNRRMHRSWQLESSYTFSRRRSDAAPLDLLAGDERSWIEDRPGLDGTDRRHRFVVNAVTLTPWGMRVGGSLRWESGLPYSALESRWFPEQGNPDGVAVPRLIYTDAGRNDRRNPSLFSIDLRLAREFSIRGARFELAAQIFNLLNDRTYRVYNAARGAGLRVDGFDDATRRPARRIELGLEVKF